MIDRRWSGPLALGIAAIGALVLAGAIATWINRSPGWAYDFHAYYDAALRFMATGTPYQAGPLTGPFRPGPFGLYLYAPVLALVFLPLTWLGEQGAILVWLAVRVAAVGLICAFMRSRATCAWPFSASRPCPRLCSSISTWGTSACS